MRQAITICTTPTSYEKLNNLLITINGYDKYPIIILSDYSFEIGKIKQMLNTDYDEFFLLQDTIEVKDPEIFEIVFSKQGKTVTLDPTMRSYLVKYQKTFLSTLDIPDAKTKLDSINIEDWLYHQHLADTTVHCLTDNFNKSDVFEEKFGRLNMVLENKWLKKYKSIWSRSQLK